MKDETQVLATVMVNSSVLIWPDEAEEFAKTWKIIRAQDRDASGMATGIAYHIKKKNENDPADLIMKDFTDE